MTVHREQSVKRQKINKMQQSEVYYQLLTVASCWCSLSSHFSQLFTNCFIIKSSIQVRDVFSEEACEASEDFIIILKTIVISLSNYSTLT